MTLGACVWAMGGIVGGEAPWRAGFVGKVGGIMGGIDPTGGRGIGCTGTPVGPSVGCGLRASGYGGLTPGCGIIPGPVPSCGLFAEKRAGRGGLGALGGGGIPGTCPGAGVGGRAPGAGGIAPLGTAAIGPPGTGRTPEALVLGGVRLGGRMLPAEPGTISPSACATVFAIFLACPRIP